MDRPVVEDFVASDDVVPVEARESNVRRQPTEDLISLLLDVSKRPKLLELLRG